MHLTTWRKVRGVLFAAPFAVLSVGYGPTTSAADPQPTNPDYEPQCDIEDFSSTTIVDAVGSDESTQDSSSTTPAAVGMTNILVFDEAIPAGTILVSGVTADPSHSGDLLDGDSTLTETGERVIVRFVDDSGATVGETLPTPDLPDTATQAPFAQPSVELSEPASGVQIVHAGDGSSANSLQVNCLNLDPVDSESSPDDLVRYLTCSDEDLGLADDLRCGFVAVPEERSDPDSRLINVAFGIVPGENSDLEPVVYLEGGPGGAPLSVSAFIQELALGEIAGERDIVFVDQRGTGYSQPTLTCLQLEDLVIAEPPLDDGEMPDPEEVAEVPEPPTEEELLELIRQETQNCRDRLAAQEIDLSAYTTVENAADVNDLRLGLGVEGWHLFGGSYGTDLALTVMRDYPEGVTSAILDSVFQPEISAGPDDLTSYQNNLDEIVARCEADDDCGAAFPNLADDINAAAENVTNEPVPFNVENADLFFGEEGLNINILSLMMIFEEANPSLPAWINGLASDDPALRYEAAQNFAQTILGVIFEDVPADARAQRSYQQRGLPGVAAFFSDGFFLSVTCSEEFPYQDEAAIPRSSDQVWSPELLEAAEFDLFSTCDIWDVNPEDPIVSEPVTSDIPSLVYASDTDFQTWPEWSRQAAETLPNSTFVEFPQLNHVVSFGNECPRSIAAVFIDNPTAELDTSCADQLPQIDYAGSFAEPPSEEELAELAEKAGVEDVG